MQDGGTAAIRRRHGFVTIRAFRRRLRIDARTFVAEFVAAIRAEDADRYAGLYAEDAVMIEPLLGEPLRGRDAIRAKIVGEHDYFDTGVLLRQLRLGEPD